jgi:hypothetical protein
VAELETVELVGAGGGVLRYLATAGMPPTADVTEVLVPIAEAIPVILRELAGWRIATADERLAAALLGAGCTPVRHAHLYSRDLVADPPKAAWLSPDLGPLRLSRLDRPASELVDVSLAAYPLGHPDAETDDRLVVEREVRALLTGAAVGPFMDVSAQVVDDTEVVAIAIINRMPGVAPMGGPWVSEVCRAPIARYAGLGSVLLRRVMADLVEHEEKSLSLVVTEGNPARQTYERLGFRYIESSRKLLVPA